MNSILTSRITDEVIMEMESIYFVFHNIQDACLFLTMEDNCLSKEALPYLQEWFQNAVFNTDIDYTISNVNIFIHVEYEYKCRRCNLCYNMFLCLVDITSKMKNFVFHSVIVIYQLHFGEDMIFVIIRIPFICPYCVHYPSTLLYELKQYCQKKYTKYMLTCIQSIYKDTIPLFEPKLIRHIIPLLYRS